VLNPGWPNIPIKSEKIRL